MRGEKRERKINLIQMQQERRKDASKQRKQRPSQLSLCKAAALDGELIEGKGEIIKMEASLALQFRGPLGLPFGLHFCGS